MGHTARPSGRSRGRWRSRPRATTSAPSCGSPSGWASWTSSRWTWGTRCGSSWTWSAWRGTAARAATPRPAFPRRDRVPLATEPPMSKPVLQLAAVGLVGFALWKLGSFFFIPLLVLAVKVALVVGLVLFPFWLFRKSDKDNRGDAPPEQHAR